MVVAEQLALEFGPDADAEIARDGFCEWYMMQAASIDHREAMAEKFLEQIKTECQHRRSALQRYRGPEFHQRVDAMLAAKNGKAKSINLPGGRAGYRSTRESVEFRDVEAAAKWAVNNFDGPTLLQAVADVKKEIIVEIHERLLLGGFTRDDLAAYISGLNKTPFIDFIKANGIVPDGIDFRESEERFYPQFELVALPGETEENPK